VWSGLNWLRVQSSGKILWTWWWPFGFCNSRRCFDDCQFSRNTLYSGADQFLREVMILTLSKGWLVMLIGLLCTFFPRFIKCKITICSRGIYPRWYIPWKGRGIGPFDSTASSHSATGAGVAASTCSAAGLAAAAPRQSTAVHCHHLCSTRNGH